MATVIVVLISYDEVPSLHIVDPIYMNVSASSRFGSFIMILMGMFSLVQLTPILLFS